jgi:hypothetical protein
MRVDAEERLVNFEKQLFRGHQCWTSTLPRLFFRHKKVNALAFKNHFIAFFLDSCARFHF